MLTDSADLKRLVRKPFSRQESSSKALAAVLRTSRYFRRFRNFLKCHRQPPAVASPDVIRAFRALVPVPGRGPATSPPEKRLSEKNSTR